MAHRHVMMFETGDDGRQWFYCSGCPAVVEVLPRAVDQELKLSLVVVTSGAVGFAPDELQKLAELWQAIFRAFAEGRWPVQGSSRRRRRSRGRAA